MTELIPPQNQDAERSVLGSAMLSRNALEEVLELVKPSDFYLPAHEAIMAAIQAMHAEAKPVDVLTVTAELRARGELDKWGGQAYMHQLIAVVPSVASAGYYARLVHEQAVRRHLVEAGVRVQQLGQDSEGMELDAIVEAAQSEVDNIGGHQHGLHTLGDELDATVDSLDGAPTFWPTPWRRLNDMMDGLRPGALYVVGARPGAGKSIVGLQLAVQMSRWGNVAVSSMEMSRRELQLRMLAQTGTIHMSALTRHALSPSDWEKLAANMEHVRSLPVFVDDRSGVSLAQIRAHVRAVGRRGPLSAVVVDYLQLIAKRDQRLSLYEHVTEVSKALKVMAREFNVPVVALAQLNRQGEGGAGRQRRAPVLADLRDSGSIEQDADVVLLLERGWDDMASVPTDDLDVHVAKNRHGMTGKVALLWEGHYARLGDSPWAP